MLSRNLYKPPIDIFNKKIHTDKIDKIQSGDNLLLNGSWLIWKHNNTNNDWSIDSYEKIYKINSIGTFWRFFNNFNYLDKINYQYFIMREGIMPIWEDINNKYGGICSIKIDYFNNKNRNELGSEIMICICLLLLNETLIINNEKLNGISYAVKNRSILIKLWINNFSENNLVELLPINFLKKIDNVIKYMEILGYKNSYKPNNVSVQYKKIMCNENE